MKGSVCLQDFGRLMVSEPRDQVDVMMSQYPLYLKFRLSLMVFFRGFGVNVVVYFVSLRVRLLVSLSVRC